MKSSIFNENTEKVKKPAFISTTFVIIINPLLWISYQTDLADIHRIAGNNVFIFQS